MTIALLFNDTNSGVIILGDTYMSTKTVEQLTSELEAMKQALKLAKQATKTKQAVTAEIHTAKESGKLSLSVAQGFRKAYLNKEQVMFIINNQEKMIDMIKSL